MFDETKLEEIDPAPHRDSLDPKDSDQVANSAAQALKDMNLDDPRDLSAMSKLQIREFTNTGATQMQATSNAMTQMAAAGAKAVNYIMDGGD